jgi:hypothetical protein
MHVTIVEVNPVSFQLARTFFWMPNGIECITADVREFAQRPGGSFSAIGIDVGGPRFSYEDTLDTSTVAGLCRSLRDGGRIAVNISCQADDDPVPGRIAALFDMQALDVWTFMENSTGDELNAIILASAARENPMHLLALAGKEWSIAHLSGRHQRKPRRPRDLVANGVGRSRLRRSTSV